MMMVTVMMVMMLLLLMMMMLMVTIMVAVMMVMMMVADGDGGDGDDDDDGDAGDGDGSLINIFWWWWSGTVSFVRCWGSAKTCRWFQGIRFPGTWHSFLMILSPYEKHPILLSRISVNPPPMVSGGRDYYPDFIYTQYVYTCIYYMRASQGWNLPDSNRWTTKHDKTSSDILT